MGWLYGWATRKDLINHLTNGEDVRKHCCVGNNLWMIVDKPGMSYIMLYLMRRGGGVWGYKDIDESMGPNAVNCPLSYLNEVSQPHNDYSREWREKVRAYHALRNRKFEPGTRLGPNGRYTIVRSLGNRGWEVDMEGWNCKCRLTKSHAAKLDIYEGESK